MMMTGGNRHRMMRTERKLDALKEKYRELKRKKDYKKGAIISTTVDDSKGKDKVYGYSIDNSKLDKKLLPPGTTPEDAEEAYSLHPDVLSYLGKINSSHSAHDTAYVLCDAVQSARKKKKHPRVVNHDRAFDFIDWK